MKVKPLAWIGSSFKDTQDLPEPVRTQVLEELRIAQGGGFGPHARQMQGDLREVTEIRLNDRAGTYRATYTTRLGSKIYVLHTFQKKSTRGIATPKRELDLIHQRLKIAKKAAEAENV